MKFGKLPKKLDSRTLQFSSYAADIELPEAVDRWSRLRNLSALGNDVYGNCTCAAAAHMVESWTVYAERGQLTIPEKEVLDAYFSISPYDQGAYLLDALNMWRKRGIGPDKIESFVEIDRKSLTQAKMAIYMFGGIYVGMYLPDSIAASRGPWTEVIGAPSLKRGHAVNIIGYNDKTRMFMVCTWGKIWSMSYDWYLAYTDEAYAVLNDISIDEATGKAPNGFDWERLSSDLKKIRSLKNTDGPSKPLPKPNLWARLTLWVRKNVPGALAVMRAVNYLRGWLRSLF